MRKLKITELNRISAEEFKQVEKLPLVGVLYYDFSLKYIKAVHVNHDVINDLLEAYPFAEKPVIKE